MTSKQERCEVLKAEWTLVNFVDAKPGTVMASDTFKSSVGKFTMELNWTDRGLILLLVTVDDKNSGSVRYSIKVNGDLYHKNVPDEKIGLELALFEELKKKMDDKKKTDLVIELRVTSLFDKPDALAKIQTQLSKFII